MTQTAEPRLSVLGVYRPQISAETWQEQWQVTGDDEYTREWFTKLVLIEEREMDCVKGTGTLRFAAYLHYYDPQRPLLWQGGEVTCPPIQDIPVRLSLLMPYRACS